MQAVTVSKDELRTLLGILNNLTNTSDDQKYLGDAIAEVNLLMPFEKCVLLHERPKTATLAYEFHCVSQGRIKQKLWKREHMKIDRYLQCFNQMDQFQNAFSWCSKTQNHAGPHLEIVDYLSESNHTRGVAGRVRTCDEIKGDSVTLIQLQCQDEQPIGKFLWYVNSIALYLHQHLTDRLLTSTSLEARQTLTPKEKDVLQWVVEGKTCWETGRILSISERTVKFHLRNIYTKLNAANRTQAVTIAHRLNLF